uniref:TauD/TfdA-like domain-containing protein n=1 Tax=Timema bartmani TaxID=61472 RepID=A0A7R9I4L8_9NEOP|nr:unnamed protein product [Timema bartmani]
MEDGKPLGADALDSSRSISAVEKLEEAPRIVKKFTMFNLLQVLRGDMKSLKEDLRDSAKRDIKSMEEKMENNMGKIMEKMENNMKSLRDDVISKLDNYSTKFRSVHDQLSEKGKEVGAQVQDLAMTGEKLVAAVEEVPEQVVIRPVKDPSTNGSYIYPFTHLGAYYERCDTQLYESPSKSYISQSHVPIMGQSRCQVNNFDWEFDYEVMQFKESNESFHVKTRVSEVEKLSCTLWVNDEVLLSSCFGVSSNGPTETKLVGDVLSAATISQDTRSILRVELQTEATDIRRSVLHQHRSNEECPKYFDVQDILFNISAHHWTRNQITRQSSNQDDTCNKIKPRIKKQDLGKKKRQGFLPDLGNIWAVGRSVIRPSLPQSQPKDCRRTVFDPGISFRTTEESCGSREIPEARVAVGGENVSEQKKVVGVEKSLKLGVGRTGWHIDGSFQSAPFSYSLYHMVSVPKQGATAFAPLTELIEGLSPERRAEWKRLWMMSDRCSGPLHPLIYPHPHTGKMVMCFHTGMVSGYVWDKGTERERYATDDEFNRINQDIEDEFKKDGGKIQYVHQWSEGEFIISDNLAVGHEATPETQLPRSKVGLRVLHRTTIKGTHPPDSLRSH